ncbi:hypothetical protein SD427_05220 [Chryseobacterium sp. JJR-5R]|nr:hypothetical protein [Chryseobacterium sp. JJR-5R]WPO83732.1 hypothetical protein SD427_05220 [Chryseobacterium sp. JJR-5R]
MEKAWEHFKNIKSKIDKNLFKSAYKDLRLGIGSFENNIKEK